MAFLLNAIFLVIAFLVLSIASGFATNAAIRVAGLPEYSGNNNLQSAHHWLTVASIVGWITVFFLLVAFFLAIFFSPEEVEANAVTGASSQSYIVDILLFLTLIATGAVGILAAIAANNINKSGMSNNNLSYRNAIISAVLAIVVAVLIIAAIIFTLTYKPKKKVTKIDKEIGELEMDLNAPLKKYPEDTFDF